MALQGQLSTFRIPSHSAMSGEKALELLEFRLNQAEAVVDSVLSPYKLILLDFSMPGMSGPETAREINRMFEEFQGANPDITLLIP